MILFVADYPDLINERDGMMQRIAAVDEFFKDRERVYLSFGIRKPLFPKKRQINDKLSLVEANTLLSFFLLAYFAKKTDFVYVHSVYYGLCALYGYLFGTVVTDMHGLVPEELAHLGRRWSSILYGLVERLILFRSCIVVTVTDAMEGHLRSKCKHSSATFLTIPLFDLPKGSFPAKVGESQDPIRVVYAGGYQKWQNVDLMIEAVTRMQNRCRFVFLSGDLALFQDAFQQAGVLDRVILKSVPKAEIYDYYRAVDLGFILRSDDVINQAACPTKLLEYLLCGIVPIVLDSKIGDFSRLGYEFLTLDDFLSGVIPERRELEGMVAKNRVLVQSLKELGAHNMKHLCDYIPSDGSKTISNN